ncbi:long chain acyl-CoA synthetase 4 [Selaginella moellendorffii]|uniref:long chain acyl-CoA synthetase 4 n=1 Tax=Selaginella moellendorffii TaxID=88036 RepID=UPI000D1CA445|nr:long chain acyl-CoA synthetase 4 [Selaginella moellendorffii]|eukprot:XP_024534363.1 long chain acyl-CoA synthetase 4 [Selaginella moellendorffii]
MEEVLDCYIVKVEEAKRDGSASMGPVYRSVYAKDGLVEAPEGARTCWELFSNTVKTSPNARMLGHRPIVAGKVGKYVWQTYQEVYNQVLYIGSAMRTLGVGPKGRCGIYGINCPAWMITLQACNGHSIYAVPLYDTLGDDAVEFIVGHAEVSIVFAHADKIPAVLRALPKCSKYVKTLVSFGVMADSDKEQVKSAGAAAYSWDEFLNLGKTNPVNFEPPKPEDICTIMYTSGTTGEPKGVLLSNESIVTAIAGIDYYLKVKNEKVDASDVYLSYLPLAHIFDRAVEEFFIYNGAAIGFFQGDVKYISDDIQELKPTLFAGVPRVFDRVYAGAKAKLAEAPAYRQAIFDFAYRRKLGYMKMGFKQEKASPMADVLVFSKVKQRLGGRARLLISGAAPLADHVEEFLRVASCARMTQGYGLTETCAASFISIPDVYSMHGTVGPPIPVIEVCLQSVPEMNYDALAETPKGEVCIRGKTLFSGYYKREDLTAECMIDGWFHTGDIGEWLPNGALKIIDRKKNIFKLSQGEYVAVENLENIYGQCPTFDSIWIYGNSFESFLVAVVIPNEAALDAWAKENDVKGDDLYSSPKAKAFIMDELSRTAKNNKLKGFEFIKAVHLEKLPFDTERDLITPTFKKKRPQLLNFYRETIDELYRGLKK